MTALRGYIAEQGSVRRMFRSESIFMLLGFIYIGFIVAVSL
jgi:hypothetical protein